MSRGRRADEVADGTGKPSPREPFASVGRVNLDFLLRAASSISLRATSSSSSTPKPKTFATFIEPDLPEVALAPPEGSWAPREEEEEEGGAVAPVEDDAGSDDATALVPSEKRRARASPLPSGAGGEPRNVSGCEMASLALRSNTPALVAHPASDTLGGLLLPSPTTILLGTTSNTMGTAAAAEAIGEPVALPARCASPTLLGGTLSSLSSSLSDRGLSLSSPRFRREPFFLSSSAHLWAKILAICSCSSFCFLDRSSSSCRFLCIACLSCRLEFRRDVTVPGTGWSPVPADRA
eukprot:CAMPEP_0115282604 /NCGR_PEP_ID=MMETSP0270-20121206/59933_1 /TAXON_ID=71861 /ORGANISM="Scrippsiella trochoidea, Strain CCMP3099" /LENGTH=293 /DNA_ID=CAMNT_0002699465 /DNA_START=20 /DNA_END=901 /DNA_ORIENTATION=+